MNCLAYKHWSPHANLFAAEINEENFTAYVVSHPNIGTMLQGRMSRVRDPMRRMNFSIYLILQAALGPGLYSTRKRNEYQKQKSNVSGE
jgi:hypothetical protein